MIHFTDNEIEQFITEDVPYYDLTTTVLRLENKPARIQFSTRADTVVCCTEEVMKMFSKLAIHTTLFTSSGDFIPKGVKFLEGEGLSKNIHTVWRASENLLGFASGIATRTRTLIDAATAVNPDIVVTTTRKIIPNTKKISVKAVQAGGASVHRLGLSESILIFNNHFSFLGDLSNLKKRLDDQRRSIGGKMVMVEIKNPEDALKVAEAGVDVIQLDWFDAEAIGPLKRELLVINPALKIAASGGITIDNIKAYAASGADMLVTSWPYYAQPTNIQVSISPMGDMVWQV